MYDLLLRGDKSADRVLQADNLLLMALVFPLLKLAVSLLCASGTSWLPRGKRRLLVYIASWTAKYSMLDVLVIAMLVSVFIHLWNVLGRCLGDGDGGKGRC